MTKTTRDFILLGLITVIITLLIWLPHILRVNFYGLDFSNGFSTIYRNYDGLEYVVVAKSYYNPQLILNLPQYEPPLYYASHFPLYPAMINVFSFMGDLKSMLFVSVLSTILSCWVFYIMLKDFKLTDHPLILSIIFLVLPARWLIIHSVGASEPLFVFLTISSFYFFLKYEAQKNFSWILLSALFGLLAQLTRPTGILLFIGLFFFVHWKYYLESKAIGFKRAFQDHLRYFPLIIIPLGVFALFYLYQVSYGDFFAYFRISDNIKPVLAPFSVFNKNQHWVGDIWLEDIVYIFIIGFMAGLTLIKKRLYPLGFFVLTYLAFLLFIPHRDISRYATPIMPFALIAFEKILVSKEFRIVLIIMAFGIYLYAQNFILNNTAPIANLAAFN